MTCGGTGSASRIPPPDPAASGALTRAATTSKPHPTMGGHAPRIVFAGQAPIEPLQVAWPNSTSAHRFGERDRGLVESVGPGYRILS